MITGDELRFSPPLLLQQGPALPLAWKVEIWRGVDLFHHHCPTTGSIPNYVPTTEKLGRERMTRLVGPFCYFSWYLCRSLLPTFVQGKGHM